MRWNVARLTPLLIGLVTLAAFLPALRAGFVNYDDDRLFTENPYYRGFGPEEIRWMFSATFMGHYQPLTWLSSAMDYTISGMDPSSYHGTNLLLHALSAVVLYFVAVRLLSAGLRLKGEERPVALRAASAFSALLFAVHPLRVESVAWASERRDVLSLLFLLLALLAYLRAFRGRRTAVESRLNFAASCALLTLSLLAKVWGMSFLFVLVALDVYPLRRLPANLSAWTKREYRRIWLQKLPFLVLGFAAALVAGWAQRSALHTMKSLEEWGIVDRSVQALYGLAFYVHKTLWPTDLIACYELPYRLDPLKPAYLLSALAVIGGVVLVILLRRRLPALATTSFLYVLILAPVLGLAQSGPQLVADKYSYVACIGWALLVGGLMLALYRRKPTRSRAVLSGAVATTVVAVLFVATWRQTGVWNDSKTLWLHALSAGPPSALAHLNYGIVLHQESRFDEAVAHWQEAVEVRPDTGNAWYLLGNALKRRNDFAAAERAYREAVRFMVRKHTAYVNLGNMYLQADRIDDAIGAYRAAVRHVEACRSRMFSPRPYLALGIALRDKGEWSEAKAMLEKASKYPDTRVRAEQVLALMSTRRETGEGH